MSQSNLGHTSYPEGYSADGIPPEIQPVLITDDVTSDERTAVRSLATDSHMPSQSAHSEIQEDSAIQRPTALRAAVPTTTDHGIADTTRDTGGNASFQSDTNPQPSTPSSPSKSSSFFSRILGGFMPSSTTPTSETPETGNYSSEPLSASWGRSHPVEQIRDAGSDRANETGLDEPTATKQAGLQAPSSVGGYERSSPNTAVAAAESLADTKAGASHDTAAAGHQIPRSPGNQTSHVPAHLRQQFCFWP